MSVRPPLYKNLLSPIFKNRFLFSKICLKKFCTLGQIRYVNIRHRCLITADYAYHTVICNGTTEWSLLESIFSSENKNPSSETQGPNFVLINILQVIMDTQICQDLKICGMPTRCKKNLLKYINTLESNRSD